MLDLDEEHEMILDTVRDVVNEHIKPKASYYDDTMEYPLEHLKQLSELGIMGLTIEEKYGGMGANTLIFSTVMEEISRGCAATATTVAGSLSLTVGPLQNYGREEVKEEFLPRLITEGRVGAFALSEPQAGSDPANLTTRAEREGDEFIINGSKIYITNALYADMYIVFARSLDIKGYKGISAFLVPREVDGINILPKEKKMGIRASPTSAMTFENVRIPENYLLGEEGKGFSIALNTLNSGRIVVAGQSVGIAQAAYDDALKFAKEREQFGQSISNFQSIQMMIADMQTKILSSRLLYYHAARLKDSGRKYVREAAQAKLVASETATFVAHKGIQIHGGSGFLKDFEAERYYRDARITEIYEGTSEIMRLVIAREELRR